MLIIGLYMFIVGCCLGSFINVVIYRLPINKSIIFPNSRCPKCDTNIKWFDNIPLISWFLLKGKCRVCETKISFSYPIIELITGILVWLNIYAQPTIYSQQHTNVIIFLGCIFSVILFTLAILDFKYFWLPQVLTFGGLVLGITTSLYLSLIHI